MTDRPDVAIFMALWHTLSPAEQRNVAERMAALPDLTPEAQQAVKAVLDGFDRDGIPSPTHQAPPPLRTRAEGQYIGLSFGSERLGTTHPNTED